jgi:hypothetical protein
MDIICTCCGEPYDIDYVLHEDPDAFKREGCLIRACDICHGVVPAHLNRRTRAQLRALVDAAKLFGDDIDGFACFLEDMQLTY